MSKSNGKKILMLATDAFGGHGGIAKFNRDFLKALCSHPNDINIVAIPRQMPNTTEQLPTKLTYVTTGLNSKFKYVTTVLNTLSGTQFDGVICGHINLLPVAFLAHIWAKVPMVLIIHGIDAWKPTNNQLTNYLVRKINAFISVSELTKQRFLSWAKLKNSKNFVLPNTIDLERYTPGPKSPALLDRYDLDGKVVLMTLGRLAANERYKGIDEVLEVLPELKRKIPNLTYLIVGDGTDRSRLEKKASSLGLNKHVIFTGLVSEQEKVEHYRLADAYVMPGYGEGFGIVYLEAMGCGIPVVASKMDASREAVRNGMLGLLVDPYDLKDIKHGILEALKRSKGIPKGLEYFSYTNFEQKVHHIVDDILSKL
jgi:glycosyltransferase involved in cell wall biosynthesis